MELKNNVRLEIYKAGYKSIREFASKNDLNYDSIVYLASGKASSISNEMLISLCRVLSCNVGDLFYIESKGA